MIVFLMNQGRQGDTFYIKQTSIPKEYNKQSLDNIIAVGEASGHKHRLVNGRLMRSEQTLEPLVVGFIETTKESKIVHDEHPEIKLDDNSIYKVKRQREFDKNTQFRLVRD